MMLTVKSCRDCANFEERRDIDDTVLRARNIWLNVCCEEFEPKDRNANADKRCNRFCVECASFEYINGTSICAKNHNPMIYCEEFKSRDEQFKKQAQEKTTLLANAQASIRKFCLNPSPRLSIKS